MNEEIEKVEFFNEQARIRAELSIGPTAGRFIICGFGSTREDAFADAKALKAELYSSAEK